MAAAEPERAFDTRRRLATTPPTAETPLTYDDRLNRILRATTDVMARVGYQKASMRAVARAAGVSLAGLYHYVPSKERLLFLIQTRTFNALLNNLREKLLGVNDPSQQLRVMVRAHVAYFAANMAALKVCSHELDSLSGESYEETRRIRHEYYKLTRTIVDRLAEDRVNGDALDRHAATMCLFGMLNWLYRWYDPQRGRSPNSVAAQIATQFLSGVLGD